MSKRFLEFETLKSLVREEEIQSRSQYWKWVDRERPIQVPKYPYRVYTKDWNGWCDFLGTNNSFLDPTPHQYRSYEAALAYAHSSSFRTNLEWKAADHPSDIPRRPDLVYRGMFKGWNSFLGTGRKGLAHKIEALQQVKEVGVMGVVVPQGNPGNVIRVVVYPGKEALVADAQKHRFMILRVFKLEDGYDWKTVLKKHGSEYGDNEYVINNVAELLWDYSNDLLMVR